MRREVVFGVVAWLAASGVLAGVYVYIQKKDPPVPGAAAAARRAAAEASAAAEAAELEALRQARLEFRRKYLRERAAVDKELEDIAAEKARLAKERSKLARERQEALKKRETALKKEREAMPVRQARAELRREAASGNAFASGSLGGPRAAGLSDLALPDIMGVESLSKEVDDYISREKLRQAMMKKAERDRSRGRGPSTRPDGVKPSLTNMSDEEFERYLDRQR